MIDEGDVVGEVMDRLRDKKMGKVRIREYERDGRFVINFEKVARGAAGELAHADKNESVARDKILTFVFAAKFAANLANGIIEKGAIIL
jgi:hypothetical protein